MMAIGDPLSEQNICFTCSQGATLDWNQILVASTFLHFR